MSVAKQAQKCDIAGAELIAHPQACPAERDQVKAIYYMAKSDGGAS